MMSMSRISRLRSIRWRASRSEPLAADRLTPDGREPAGRRRLGPEALPRQKREGVLIPVRRLEVVAEDRAGGLRLVGLTEREEGLGQAVERLGRLRRRLEVLDDDAEAVDRRLVVSALQVIPPDLHFLRAKVIEREVELQDRRAGVFAVGMLLDHATERLQRLEGQPLIAADVVDLVVVAEREEIFGIGRVLVGGIEVDEALRRRPRAFVVAVAVIGEGLHDEAALGPFRIGIEPLDLAEEPRRL